ncbi:MAG TPA: hypothetical protein VJT31_09500, partial [Rugosimonospora sp.]|nr:hypothetical protein [Rugosimonospora sp.]
MAIVVAAVGLLSLSGGLFLLSMRPVTHTDAVSAARQPVPSADPTAPDPGSALPATPSPATS